MATSRAKTVAAYLKELPADRRKIVSAMRRRIRANLPRGYEEAMNWGMITYQIPLKQYPGTYNGQPACYAGLVAQKNFYTLYLMAAYGATRRELEAAFRKAGKKLDMGRSCLHFRDLDDLPLDAVDKCIRSTPPEKMIEMYEASRRRARARKSARK